MASERVAHIRKLVVANRGEIAARIFATCRRLGIATVAVAAPDDRGAFHTRRADAVEAIGSYLSASDVVDAATRAGADGVHPGYGFLAESAGLAEAVRAAGLRWVGPPPDVLRAAGDKLEAKRIAAAAGIPVVETGSPEELGFPLVIKAAAGGGGRGMRVVRSPAELDEAAEAARREAMAAFGDDRVFFERYVERPRHVEIQLLADAHGAIVHLGERECSIQRRYQKVLEESPSPALDPPLRHRMGEAAVAFAGALAYEGAGTAEFILGEDGRFAFLELNARIQVEHPVTELVTDVDLVEQQLRVAAGEALALEPRDPDGHAVEVRVYAEHPLTFLPQAGRVERLALPDGVRVDAGVEAGDEVPVAYDPMIAKLIAHAETRAEALERLALALDETRVSGVTTNLPLLRWLVRHPAVRDGQTTTAFLVEHPPLSRFPRIAPPWRGYWRLNRDHATPPPVRRPPPVVETASHATDAVGHAERTLVAPMPGTVIRVLAGEGDRVEPRQTLVVLEAMKMETPLGSPYEATVRRVNVAEGDRVTGGTVLVELEA
ncbi:MAG TPA: biotin carboxylase N-terminal domain-containing protein [Gaiellaceae bacterium]|nr:biotin carboxylase N-terminal domain-containing protein [Gaiellaceae bacterium]